MVLLFLSLLSDEDSKDAPFQPSGMTSRMRCYSAMGMSHDPKPKHSHEDKAVWADEAPVRVRQTRHDVPPLSPTVTQHGHIPARGKEATKNQMSSVGLSDSRVDEQDVHVRQALADGKCLHSSVMEKDIAQYRPRSSNMLVAGQKHYNKASSLGASHSSKDALNANELDESLNLHSSKSSMKSRESLRKLAETLGYLPSEAGPSTLTAVELEEPPTVFKRCPSENTQSWGTSMSHLYENLPNEDVVAAISAIPDVFPTGDGVGHLKHVSSNSAIQAKPTLANYTDTVSTVVRVGGEKQHEVPLPRNTDSSDSQPAHESGATLGSNGSALSRAPSNVSRSCVITPPPEFAGDFGNEGEEAITEDQGRDFTVDWTPRLARQRGPLMQFKSEESIAFPSSHLEQRTYRVQQAGNIPAASGLVTSSAVEAAPVSVEGKAKWDKQDSELNSCSGPRMSGVRSCTRESSNASISKLPGYISVCPTEEPQHAVRLFISNPYEESDTEVPLDSHRSTGSPSDLTKPAMFRSEMQLTSSASSSPGSKTSQCIIAASSPKLKLLGDSLNTQPLSKLAKLVNQMHQHSPKPQVPRSTASTEKAANASDVVKKKLQMPEDAKEEAAYTNDTLARREPERREGEQCHDSVKEHRSPKDATSAVAASRESKWQGEPATGQEPLPSEQQDSQHRAVGERRYSKKRAAAKTTSEANATVVEQEKGGGHHLGSGPAQPGGYVSRQQVQSMAVSRTTPVMNRPSSTESQLHSAQFYNDLIHPYAVSRRYYPDEFRGMPPPSPSSMGGGYQQCVTQRMPPSPVNPQFVEEAMFSQSVAFPPNMRNSYQYHSFQTYSNNPLYHPARVVSPVTPPPVYLHPPSYYQGPAHREETQVSSGVRHRLNGQESFDKIAFGVGVQSGQQQFPMQQRHHTAAAHSSFQRPSSRADVPRGFTSPDPHMLMHNQEPFPLSQPVDSSAYQYQQYAFKPNFRHSFGAASMNTVGPAASYQYPAPSWPNQSSSWQHRTYVRYQPGDTSRRRPMPTPRAHTPIVLTTPASSSAVRRSKETLLDKDSSGFAYCLL